MQHKTVDDWRDIFEKDSIPAGGFEFKHQWNMLYEDDTSIILHK